MMRESMTTFPHLAVSRGWLIDWTIDTSVTVIEAN